ncbi:MAG TPA: hypothetical protein VKE49_01560 [Myxococcaceae bacterium]|nr:hypothetical protein [Myxococcaceae bacterium]
MSGIAAETAYYLNSKLPALALVGKGVRFPAGQWMRVADVNVRPWHAEELVGELFPSLNGKGVEFAVLLTDFDVLEFERGLFRFSGYAQEA